MDGFYQTTLLAGSMCQWLIPWSLRGCPLPLFLLLLSPPHHHLHRWVLLFPHRILMMAKKDSKGAGAPPPPFNASSGEEWQAVDEGGEREGPTSKQTTANTNKDGCLSAFL